MTPRCGPCPLEPGRPCPAPPELCSLAASGPPGYAGLVVRLAEAGQDLEVYLAGPQPIPRSAKPRVPLGTPHCPSCLEARRAGGGA